MVKLIVDLTKSGYEAKLFQTNKNSTYSLLPVSFGESWAVIHKKSEELCGDL